MRKVLICGYPRSGNSLLYRTVVSLQGPNHISFMESVGLSNVARAQCGPFMSFPEIAHLDNLRLPGGEPHLEYPHPECRTVKVSPSLLEQVSTLIWTHELPGKILKSAFHSRRSFYMIRDGRDVISSMIHYSVTESSRRLQPHYQCGSAEEIYANLELFRKWTIEWASHMNSYLENRDHFFAVHYENLVSDRERQMKEITAHICDPGSEEFHETCGRIGASLKATDREKFRARAPDHMHRGRPGGWREEWSEEHVQVFFSHAGQEMSRLGYV